jgi:sulfonate transport system substrate-binding protein
MWRQTNRLRRFACSGLAAVMGVLICLSLLAGCGAGGKPEQGQVTGEPAGKQGKPSVIRIGYQKYGTLNMLKARGDLEKRFAALGYSIQWALFPGGPQLLEAMNAGSIDLGHTGDAPPIFAQAAGTPMVYVAATSASPESEAILVKADSPIQKIADLKGKKVALNKGSNVHYFLVKALESAGLQWKDIQPVYLPPADARMAFEKGSVDAWVIWDPFYAAAQQTSGSRVLTDGKHLVANREFFLASQTFAKQHADLLPVWLEELKKVDEWAKQDPHGVASFLAPELGIDIASLERASKRRAYDVEPISDTIIAEQQNIADTFYRIGLIGKPIHVKEAVLPLQP